jgi:hypothetical protein
MPLKTRGREEDEIAGSDIFPIDSGMVPKECSHLLTKCSKWAHSIVAATWNLRPVRSTAVPQLLCPEATNLKGHFPQENDPSHDARKGT